MAALFVHVVCAEAHAGCGGLCLVSGRTGPILVL